MENLAIKKLNDLSWAEIKDILETGNGAAHFEIGDEKTERLSTGEEVDVKLISVTPHDELADGSDKARATFMFYINGSLSMNYAWTNKGGWHESEMRNIWMPRLFALLPKDMQDVIVLVKKQASAGERSEELLTSEDKLFLTSEIEVFGKTDVSFTGEGEQYEYFKTNKMQDKWTWTRSAVRGGSFSFVRVCGDVSCYDGAHNCDQVALCFCI